MPRRRHARGLTLIELIVTVALIAGVTTAVVMGSGAVVNSRMKRAGTMITGLVRLAFTRASATSKVHRIVFDIDGSRVLLEESSGQMLVLKNDTAGGAEGVTAEEREAIAQADKILKGPRAPRARFSSVSKVFGFDQADEKEPGKAIGRGLKFRSVETSHSPDGQSDGRAYLYFWPGGQTERAAIQLKAADSQAPDDGMTLFVSPLTGKVRIVNGAKSMEKPRDDGGPNNEREDRSF